MPPGCSATIRWPASNGLGLPSATGVLAIDEVGYLSYDSRYADLFFEVITRRYQKNPVIITTNKPFGEWTKVFPNAGCVVTLVDRLMHKAELLNLEGKSYRYKEAQDRPDSDPPF
jgi:DNA replication protein DnaC